MVLEPQVSNSLLPSQQQLLLRVQHLATIESNLLLITGRVGAGKYTIASSLLDRYGSEFNLAWLTCHEKSAIQSLRQQLLTQIFPHQTISGNAPLLQLINQQTIEPSSAPWMIVVSRAELMSNQLLVELWGLVEQSLLDSSSLPQVSILLFAEPVWANRVAKEMNTITGADLPLLQVPPLSIDERKQLFVDLQSRLGDDRQDVDLVERQLSEQDGLPGEVVALFNRSPDKHLAVPHADKLLSLNFPDFNKWFLLIPLLLVMATVLWWSYQSAPSNKVALPTPNPESAVTMNDRELELLPDPEMEVQVQDNLDVLPQPIAEQTLTLKVEDENDKLKVAIDEPLLMAIEKHQELTQPSAELVNIDETTAEADPVEQEVQPEPSTAIDVLTQVKTPSPKPSAPELVVNLKQPWWQSIESGRYVLQVAVMSSKSRLEQFANQQKLANDPRFRRYVTKRNGKLIYIGVYGDYPSKESARKAVAALPSSLAKLTPWPKPISAIQAEAVDLE